MYHLITNSFLLKRSYCLIILFFLVSESYGQRDYKEGFIISHSYDTVRGYIDLRSDYKNSKECVFTKNPKQDPTIYLPGEIKAYRVNNSKYYVSKILPSGDPYFMEFVVNGIVDLFYLKNNDNTQIFIEKEGELIQLTNEESLKSDKDGNKYSHYNQLYKGTLTYLFQEAPQLFDDIDRTTFSVKSIAKVTKQYHNAVCSDYECIDYTKQLKANINVELTAGYFYHQMGLNSSSDLASSGSIQIGANARIYPGKVHYLWNLTAGILIRKYRFSDTFKHGWGTNALIDHRYHKVQAEYFSLSIPLMVNYSFPAKKLQPYISAGLINTFIFNPEINISSVSNLPAGPVFEKFRNYQYGLRSGAGVRLLRNSGYYFAEVQGEYRVPLANTNNFLDHHFIRGLEFSVGYGF